MGQQDYDITPEHLIPGMLADMWQDELVDRLNWAGAQLIRRGLPALSVNGKVPCNRRGSGRSRWTRAKCTEEKLQLGLRGALDPLPPGYVAPLDADKIITYRPGNPAIGLRMGPGSAIDIESDGPDEELAVAYLFDGCNIPPTPTFESTRGIHQLFNYDERLAILGDVYTFTTPESLRVGIRIGACKGAHSVIPPSYGRSWLPRLSLEDFNYNFADLPELVIERLLEHFNNTSITTTVDQYEHNLVISITTAITTSVPPPDIKLDECLSRTTPRKAGDRNARVFQFVRYLKALDHYRELDPDNDEDGQVLYGLVVRWYARAVSMARSRGFVINGSLEQTWNDFRAGWRNVKHPVTRETLRMAYEKSKHENVGSVLELVNDCQSPSLPYLIALCSMLQRLHGIEAFPLDCRAVADVMKVGKSTVHRNIQRLVDRNILAVDRPGSYDDGLAAEYIYLPTFERGEAEPLEAAA